MTSATIRKYFIALARWIDTSAGGTSSADGPQKTDWFRCIPFVAVHLMCLGIIWVGWSPVAVGVAIALYFIRMFAITGFYHRYFSHRSFKTTRFAQFTFAVMGATCVQRGALWWASHHRLHHQRSDEPADVHSPRQHGFIWSHIGWITSESNFRSELRVVRDLMKFPELMFLDRFDALVPTILGFALFGLGALLQRKAREHRATRKALDNRRTARPCRIDARCNDGTRLAHQATLSESAGSVSPGCWCGATLSAEF